MRHPRGRDASSPWSIPLAGWKDVVTRTWKEAGTDNIGLIAAGVAFYAFLAIVPILGGIVMSYGLVASPETVTKTVVALTKLMPREAADLVGKELATVVAASDSKKGLGLLVAFFVSLYGAMNAAGAIVTALNIAYEEKEKRGFFALLFLSLLITVSGILLVMTSMTTIAITGYLGPLLPTLPDFTVILGKILTYAITIAVGAAAAASLYRFGPSRRRARWVWLSPGSLLTSLLWVVVSAGFGLYVANFGNYDATYGSLGAVVVMLTWLYLSAYVLLLGAELNAELERQTACDSTTGPPRPLGERGARMADTVASPGGDVPNPPAVPTLAPPSDPPPFDPPSPKVALAPAPPGPVKDLIVARASARALTIGQAGAAKPVALLPTVLTTTGLMMLRRKGRERLGLILLASGGGLAWLGRDRSWVAARPRPKGVAQGRLIVIRES